MPRVFQSLLDQIQDQELRDQVATIIDELPHLIDAPFLPLEQCPAGAYRHHSYPGGLVEHVHCVARIAQTLCDLVEDHYGGEVNRDAVMAGIILHDLMKCYCYEERGDGGFRTSEFGGRVDHLSLMVGVMVSRGFPWELVHIVASHHGETGPTKPKSLEALIVAISDLADSEFNGRILRAAEYLLQGVGVRYKVFRSGGEAVEVVQTKGRGGWEGLKRLLGEKG